MRNKSVVSLAIVAALGFASQAWCVEPRSTAAPFTPPSDAFQVRYASNLSVGDSVINITNGGTQGGTDPSGNICVNVYAFSPDEQLVSCCSCLVTPNGLVHLSANNDLVSNTLTGIRPSRNWPRHRALPGPKSPSTAMPDPKLPPPRRPPIENRRLAP